MAGDLQDLRRQLADVMAELAGFPKHLIGSEKHHDRAEEARWLVRTIERMEGKGRCASVSVSA